MDVIEYISDRLPWNFKWLVDWAIRNWAVTMIALVLLIYWAGRQRRVHRRHS
jgi:hypothetical protein